MNTEATNLWDIPISPSLQPDQILGLLKLGLEADDDGDMALDFKAWCGVASDRHTGWKQMSSHFGQGCAVWARHFPREFLHAGHRSRTAKRGSELPRMMG